MGAARFGYGVQVYFVRLLDSDEWLCDILASEGSDSVNENNVKGLLVWIAWSILAHTFLTCLMLERSGLTFCLEDLSWGMMFFCLASYFSIFFGVLNVFCNKIVKYPCKIWYYKLGWLSDSNYMRIG